MIVIGGWPGRQVIGLNGRFGVRVAELATGGTEPNPFLNNFDVGDDAATEMVVVVTSLPGSGTVTLGDDGDFQHTGAADGTYHTIGAVYSWAPGGPLVAHATPEDITTTFGTAGTVATVSAAGGIASAEAVGAPVVTAVGAAPVSISGAGGIESQEAIGMPVVGGTLPPAQASVTDAGGVSSQEAIGLPIISVPGSFVVTPTGRVLVIRADEVGQSPQPQMLQPYPCAPGSRLDFVWDLQGYLEDGEAIIGDAEVAPTDGLNVSGVVKSGGRIQAWLEMSADAAMGSEVLALCSFSTSMGRRDSRAIRLLAVRR